MEVYLLRHGSAEPGRAGDPDSARALTDEGSQEIKRVISSAKLAHVCPSLVLSSPYRRALETARIAGDLLDYGDKILTSHALIPDADVHGVWDEIRAHKDQSCILLAGHDPLFSSLAAYLLGCPELRVDFPKGGLMRIDIEGFAPEPSGTLKWMLTPKLAPL